MTATDDVLVTDLPVVTTPPVIAVLGLPSGPVAVVGASAVVPGEGVPGLGPDGGPLTSGPGTLLEPGVPGEFDARGILGRKGLRYKDRATLLGTAAAELALREAGWALGTGAPSGVGVVVASCYGNLDTVCSVAAAIDEGGVASISPMDLPNASSNVIAAGIAIRGHFQGVCLSVCNGHTGGWDALVWAGRLLAAGRAPAVVVVGVETPSPAESALRDDVLPLADGAAAVVLTAAPAGPAIGAMTHRANPVGAMSQGANPVAGRVNGEGGAAAGLGAAGVLGGYETASLGGVVDLVAAVQTIRAGGGAVGLQRPGAWAPWPLAAP